MTAETFGRWLKRRRSGMGLTQPELAERVGYAWDTIQKVETDKLRPSKALAARLAEALDIPPEDRDAFVRFARDQLNPERVTLPTQTADLPAAGAMPNSRPITLPLPPTALVGREDELAALTDALAAHAVRLVTLTGPGGSGKTRLALEVAHHLLAHFPDGVTFVNLAPIRDPTLILPSIAQALDVREAGGRPLRDLLQDYLREKQLLLLLDNFEQIVAAAPAVADLLAHAPHLKILVTSRVPLHVRGEKEFAVPPLPLPASHQLPPLEQLTQYAAVALFIQRAQDVRRDFQVTNDNAPAVAEICHRLDGLPLAIELAAARIKALPPQALLQRLERRLPTLVGGPRDLPARQQTLRNAIAWSYDLLDEGEKTLFRRLGVFVGGCALEAVEAVCGDDDEPVGKQPKAASGQETSSAPTAYCLPPADVLDGLIALVDKSLLKHEEGPEGEPRYVMLETIREFALEQLEAVNQVDLLRCRHAQFFLRLTEQAEPHLMHQEQVVWLARLDVDYQNLRAALHWVHDTGDMELELRLVGALGDYWSIRGYLSEGGTALIEALRRAGSAGSPKSRAKVLFAASLLASREGDYPTAYSLVEASSALCQSLGDQRGRARALDQLGWLARTLDDRDAAHAYYKEGLMLAREIGDKSTIAIITLRLGILAQDEGDFVTAYEYYQDALVIWRELGQQRGMAAALTRLGSIALLRDDYRATRALVEQALALQRVIAEKAGIASSLTMLAMVALRQGDYGQTRLRLGESLRVYRDIGDRLQIAEALENFAELACLEGQLVQAVRLFAAGTLIRDTIGAHLLPAERPLYESYLARARETLSTDEFTALWSEGQAMTLEEAIAYALGEDGRDEASSPNA